MAKSETYSSNGLNQYVDVTIDGILVGLTYDDAGNLLSDGTWTYTYDVENRLLSANDGVTLATYVYDPLGRRVSKTINGVATYYLNDGTEEILELNASGSITRRYVFGSGVDEPIVMWDGASTSNTIINLYHFDPRGSIIATTKNNGNVRELYTYSAYGEPDDPTGQPIRFAGRRWDAETGLYFYRSRYYNPALGRFLQTDPVGYKDNNNLYSYVANDPLNRIDPSGETDIYIGGAKDGSRKIVQRFATNPNATGEGTGRTVEYFKQSEVKEAIAFANANLGNGEPLNIIGHSWGADAAVEVAAGVDGPVDTLVGVDPVNKPTLGSIFGGDGDRPENVKNVVTVKGVPTDADFSNTVEGVGKIAGQPDTFQKEADTTITVNANHEEFAKMFTSRGDNDQSAQDIVNSTYENTEDSSARDCTTSADKLRNC